MSSRRGIEAAISRKRSNRYEASCGPGPGLGVVLDRRARHVAQHQALDGAVVEVHVRQLGGAEVGLPADRLVGVDRAARRPGPSTAKPWFCEVMSILPVCEVLDRVVGAAVAERELEGLEADRAAEQLVAEADAEHRHLADQLAHVVDDVVERGRVAGAVGEEDRVRRRARAGPRRDVSQGCSSSRTPRSRRLRDDRVLDAGVDRDDARAVAAVEQRPARPA